MEHGVRKTEDGGRKTEAVNRSRRRKAAATSRGASEAQRWVVKLRHSKRWRELGHGAWSMEHRGRSSELGGLELER